MFDNPFGLQVSFQKVVNFVRHLIKGLNSVARHPVVELLHIALRHFLTSIDGRLSLSWRF
jgi:hypothetical protein